MISKRRVNYLRCCCSCVVAT